MGPGAVDTGTDPGPGGAPARGDVGAAAAAAPHSQARCSSSAGHPPPACDHGGPGCHRGCRADSRRDYTALRTLSGVAPVTKRSGKSCIVIMRYAAQLRLRNAVFHWARVAVLNDPK